MIWTIESILLLPREKAYPADSNTEKPVPTAAPSKSPFNIYVYFLLLKSNQLSQFIRSHANQAEVVRIRAHLFR